MMQNEWDKALFENNGKAPARHIPHFTDAEREQFRIKANHVWKQRGNQLYCECELGLHTSFIPTNKLMTGTDENGLPMLTDVKV